MKKKSMRCKICKKIIRPNNKSGYCSNCYMDKREHNRQQIAKSKTFLLLSLVVVLCLAVSFVSATIESLGTVKQYDCINLPQSSNLSTACNITSIQYPNKTTDFTQRIMTKQGTSFNYTFCSTSALNDYIINGFCNGDGVWAYDFTVTPTGGDRINSFGIFIIFIFISTIVLGMAMIFQNGFVGFIAGCLFLVTGVYVMIYGLGNMNDTWTQSVSYIILGMGLIFCVSAGIQIIGETGFGISRPGDED